MAATILMAPFPSAASADMMVRLPASTDPGVFLAQRTMVEAWTIVGETYVDESFNGHDWVEELRDRMLAAYYAAAPEEAWGQLAGLLEDLGDPYTRRISPREYESFRVSADGEMQGVGLLIASEPVNGHLLVLAPIEGGPADRAGVLPGDEVISIDGQSMYGWNAQRAATVLRGGSGTEVQVKLIRRTEQIPGVPGRPEPMPRLEYKELRLRRERVQISPVYAALLAPPAPPPSASSPGPTPVMKVASLPADPAASAAAVKRTSQAAVSLHSLSIHLPSFPLPWATTPAAPAPEGPAGQQQQGQQQQPGGVGYLRLTQFSGNAAQDLAKAITRLEADGASSLILDLRNNPGGLVTAGLEVAHLLLDGQPVVFNVSAREGEVSSQTTEDAGPALTHLPLAVLVDGNSASASEIVSGALRDYGRAVVIGDANTYGKGKIQSVFELQDGSALFVTVAKYQTPNGTEIDKKGIHPDLSCSPASLSLAMAAATTTMTEVQGADAGAAAQMEAMAAAAAAGASNFQPGLPVGPGSAEVLAAQLMEDRCVITARQVLASPSIMAAALRGEALGATSAPAVELATMSASLPAPAAAAQAQESSAPSFAPAAPGQPQGEEGEEGSGGGLQSAELSVL